MNRYLADGESRFRGGVRILVGFFAVITAMMFAPFGLVIAWGFARFDEARPR